MHMWMLPGPSLPTAVGPWSDERGGCRRCHGHDLGRSGRGRGLCTAVPLGSPAEVQVRNRCMGLRLDSIRLGNCSRKRALLHLPGAGLQCEAGRSVAVFGLRQRWRLQRTVQEGLVPYGADEVIDLGVQGLHVVHDGVHVQAAGLALESKATVQELAHVHVSGAVVVDELEESLRIAGVQAQSLEKGCHARILQVLVDLLQAHSAGAVLVHLDEEVSHLCRILLFELHLLRDEEISRSPCGLHSIFDEDARHDVHDGQHRERHVEDEEAACGQAEVQQAVRADAPAHAAQHGLDEAVDRAGKASKPLLECNYLALVAHVVLVLVDEGRSLAREQDGEDVDDERQQYERPSQVRRRVHDHERQKAQLLEEPENAKNPDDSQHLDCLHACGHCVPAPAGAQVHNEVHYGEDNKGQVEDVPAPVFVAEIHPPLHVHPHEQLDHEEDAARVTAGLQEERLLRIALGLLLDPYSNNHGVQRDHDCADGVKQRGLDDALDCPALPGLVRLVGLPPGPGHDPPGRRDRGPP
mmetsp:Transcript_17294/g.54098  ORF Transcript_17294/g.54098 Transcript_17294/m.54098 type:complete len:524 (-) Transcript_17294:686-2257(-)